MRYRIMEATLVAAGTLSLCATAWAQDAAEHRFYVAPSFTYTITPHSRGTNNGFGGEIAIGKRMTPFLDLELLGSWTRYKVNGATQGTIQAQQQAAGLPVTSQPDSTQLIGIGGGVNLYAFTTFNRALSGWGLPSIGALFRHLYIHGDIRYSTVNRQPGLTKHHYTGTLFDAGLGYNVPLHFLFDGALRVQAMYRLDQHNQKDIGVNGTSPSNNFDEMVYSVGLRIPLGSNRVAAETAPSGTEPGPVHVVPVAPAPPAPASPAGGETPAGSAAAGGMPAGGAPGTGGAPNVGGAPTAGGTSNGGAPAGGAPGAGGAPSTGGAPAGGTPGTGGATNTEGAPAGGAPGTGSAPGGGAPTTGGTPSTGGASTSGAPAGGAPPL